MTDCMHQEKELRRMVTEKGTTLVRWQCLECGINVETVKKFDWHAKGIIPANLPDWDSKLANVYWQRKHEESEKARFEQHRQDDEKFWKRHEDVMLSERWKKIRRLVLARCSGVCEGCGEEAATQIHHETYERLGCEMLFDLRGVCRQCHDRFHARRSASILLSSLTNRGFSLRVENGQIMVSPSKYSRLSQSDSEAIRVSKIDLVDLIVNGNFR